MQRDHIRPSVCALRCTSAKVAIKKEREGIECQGFPRRVPPPFASVCVYKKEMVGCGNSTPPFRIAGSVPIPRGPYFPIATKLGEWMCGRGRSGSSRLFAFYTDSSVPEFAREPAAR